MWPFKKRTKIPSPQVDTDYVARRLLGQRPLLPLLDVAKRIAKEFKRHGVDRWRFEQCLRTSCEMHHEYLLMSYRSKSWRAVRRTICEIVTCGACHYYE